jgi:low temperature requirement protein LtrA
MAWHEPPRLRSLEDDAEERRATWLELFFDLVFVVAIAQLALGVGNEVTLRDFLIFAGLFVPIWWAWVGYTFYADRFDTDDAPHRLLMFVGMFTVAALASTIPEAYDGDTAGFAVAYAATRSIVILLNARAWWHLPPARPLLNVYIPAFAASAALFLVSLLFEGPARYVVWAVALAIDLGTPLMSAERIRLIPIHTSHIPERVGLFTIIVFGETVLAVVVGTETVSWELDSGVVAVLGFTIAAAIWWLYFDYLDTTIVGRTIASGQVYLFAHLPLLTGLAALGPGVKLAIKSTGSDNLSEGTAWMLGGGIALVMAAMGVIQLVTARTGRSVDVWLRFGTAVLAVGLAAFGDELGPIGLTGLLAAVLVAQVVLELVGHEAHRSSDLELDGGQVDREGSAVAVDGHLHGSADEVADH